MPFSSRELSVLAYANGFTLWHYRTADPLAALTAPDGSYFAAADELLRPGDNIIVTMTEPRLGGGMLIVTAVTPGRAVEVGPVAWPAPLQSSETAAGRSLAAVC